MKNYKAKSVADFIAHSPKETRSTLKELRRIIKATVPKADESISWGIPFYKYQGLLAGFAPCKNYVLFGLVAALSAKDRKIFESKGYKTGKKTVQIRYDQKAPVAEMKRMLKAQAKSNEIKKMTRGK
jgi:uncharacterized protein YdhG (YjbR/CyaY superfamily)